MRQLKETPLPKKQMFIICCVRVAEPINFAMIFPFVYFVRDFHVTDDPFKIAYYVGYLASSFAFAQFLTGLFWGWLSDRIGRRPVILLGLSGVIISALTFGLSRSYAMAMTARTICGLLSGNIGVLRSMVGEITDETNQARAISLLPFVYGLGSLLGSILGGFLSQPAKQYPSIFGECEFLKTYPYFLPCAITAIICLIGFIIGYFYLEETLPSKIAKNQSVEYEATESESLLQNKSHKSYQSASIEDVSVVAVSGDKKSGLQALFTKQILLVVSTFMFIALQQVMDSELFPLWVVTSVDHGGLSFGSEQIGIALGYQGLLTLFIQLLWFPWAHNRYGTLNLLRTILHISPLVYFFQGLIRMLVPLGQEFVWLALIVILSFKTLTVVVSMSCSMILINSSTPDRHSLGTLNGLSQCMFSLMTTIGPTLCGIIYSWSLRSPLRFPFDEHTAFFVITLVGLITCIISWFIEDPKNIRNK